MSLYPQSKISCLHPLNTNINFEVIVIYSACNSTKPYGLLDISFSSHAIFTLYSIISLHPPFVLASTRGIFFSSDVK